MLNEMRSGGAEGNKGEGGGGVGCGWRLCERAVTD